MYLPPGSVDEGHQGVKESMHGAGHDHDADASSGRCKGGTAPARPFPRDYDPWPPSGGCVWRTRWEVAMSFNQGTMATEVEEVLTVHGNPVWPTGYAWSTRIRS